MDTRILIPHTAQASPQLSVGGRRRYAQQEKRLMLCKVAKFVLFAYILLLFKPVMPIFSDILAHALWERQHIMMVHEVHGQFHIHQELANVQHQSDKEKSNEANKYEVAQYVHVHATIFSIFQNISANSVYPAADEYRPISYSDIISPPPTEL